jgi:hypothetical protein
MKPGLLQQGTGQLLQSKRSLHINDVCHSLSRISGPWRVAFCPAARFADRSGGEAVIASPGCHRYEEMSP